MRPAERRKASASGAAGVSLTLLGYSLPALGVELPPVAHYGVIALALALALYAIWQLVQPLRRRMPFALRSPITRPPRPRRAGTPPLSPQRRREGARQLTEMLSERASSSPRHRVELLTELARGRELRDAIASDDYFLGRDYRGEVRAWTERVTELLAVESDDMVEAFLKPYPNPFGNAVAATGSLFGAHRTERERLKRLTADRVNRLEAILSPPPAS